MVKTDTLNRVATIIYAFTVLGMAFYGLILFEFELDDLVKGALIAWAGASMAFMFAQETAKSAAAASQKAYTTGLATPTPPTTTTVTSEGPPATSTTTTIGEAVEP